MPINGETMVSEELYRAAIKAILRQALATQILIGVCVGVIGLGLTVFNLGAGIGVAIGGAAIGLVLPRRSISVSTRCAAPALAGAWRFAIDDQGITVTTPIAKSEFAWTTLSGLEDHDGFWLMRTPLKHQALLIVKSAFPSSEQDAVAQILIRKTGSAKVDPALRPKLRPARPS